MNPILKQAEQAVLAKLNPPQLAQGVQKMVAMGRKTMYSPQMRSMLASQLGQKAPMPHIVGEGVAKLMGILMHASKNTLPPEVSVPAAAMLVCEALDMLESMGRVRATPELLAQSIQEMTSALLQLYGVSPQKLQALLAQRQGAQPAPSSVPSPAPAPQSLIASAGMPKPAIGRSP